MKDDKAAPKPDGAKRSIPPEPLTLEGSYILHQMIRVRWPEWKACDPNRRAGEVAAAGARQRDALASRLWPAIPARPYVCFYPMDKRRGESRNWYALPIEQRQAMMHDHGMIGCRYAGLVTQIISGSIRLDNWEWGVD